MLFLLFWLQARMAVWYGTVRYKFEHGVSYFKNLPYNTIVKKQRQILYPYGNYVLLIGWYALNAQYLRGTVRRQKKLVSFPKLSFSALFFKLKTLKTFCLNCLKNSIWDSFAPCRKKIKKFRTKCPP